MISSVKLQKKKRETGLIGTVTFNSFYYINFSIGIV